MSSRRGIVSFLLVSVICLTATHPLQKPLKADISEHQLNRSIVQNYSVHRTPKKVHAGDAETTPVVTTVSVTTVATIVTDTAEDEAMRPSARKNGRSRDRHKQISKSVPILMYHSISDNPKNLLCLAPERFSEQMKYLKDAGYHTITFNDLADWKEGRPIPEKPVLITFDDGYRDNYTNAFPVLQKENLDATIFMVYGFFNGKNSLTDDMAKEMLASGLISFGSHTESHMDLTTLPLDRLKEEVIQSKTDLEKMLGIPITAFCYPSGRYNDKTLELVKEAGYQFAVTTKPGWAERDQGDYTLHRVRINGDLTITAFKQMFP